MRLATRLLHAAQGYDAQGRCGGCSVMVGLDFDGTTVATEGTLHEAQAEAAGMSRLSPWVCINLSCMRRGGGGGGGNKCMVM